MKEIKPVYYIEYQLEGNDKNNYYRKVESDNPQEVPYEKGIISFKVHQVLVIGYNGEKYHIFIKRGSEEFAFGSLERPDDILAAIQRGETFGIKEKSIIDFMRFSKESLVVSPTKKLYMDNYKGYIRVNNTEYQNAPVAKKEKIENQVDGKKVWYIEYKNSGETTTHLKPTFCNDKKFRFEEGMEEYRFIEVAEFEIDNQKGKVIINSEPWQRAVRESSIDREKEVYRAVDGAKAILYNQNEKQENYFEGYTRIYPFNTEDSASVFKKRKENIDGKNVLTVTGSGDALLDLFLNGAENVTCFDCNGLAKYYAKLKFYAIKSGMSFEEYKEFFLGNQIGNYVLTKNIYDKFKDTIDDEDTRTFWDSLYSYEAQTNLHIANNYENLLTYRIIGLMMSESNKTCGNPNSYFNEESYQKLQEILKCKSMENLEFKDVSLLELPNELEASKSTFDYMYLSNIIDFTSLYIFKAKVGDRLEVFRDFIFKELSKSLSNDGIIDAGYLAQDWRTETIDTVELEDYKRIFEEIHGFCIESLMPYNRDSVLSYEGK